MKKQADISTRNGAKYSEEMSNQCPQKGWREWKDFRGLGRGGRIEPLPWSPCGTYSVGLSVV